MCLQCQDDADEAEAVAAHAAEAAWEAEREPDSLLRRVLAAL